jgi:hypothetical protein
VLTAYTTPDGSDESTGGPPAPMVRIGRCRRRPLTVSRRHGFADQELPQPIAAVVSLRPEPHDDLSAPIDDWLAEYPDPRTQQRYGGSVRLVARAISAGHPPTSRLALIHDYLSRYADGLGHEPPDDAPVFCVVQHSRRSHLLRWGTAMTTAAGLRLLLARRAHAAGPGYMAPHDLKRTTARIMHEARSDDGGHLFDLLDIADVLDHSNPKVTKDCYIGPLDTTTSSEPPLCSAEDATYRLDAASAWP